MSQLEIFKFENKYHIKGFHIKMTASRFSQQNKQMFQAKKSFQLYFFTN